ncbi:MAG: NMD3-related protein [Candidatus Burarchaeum sp.]|nr:NMD3-related protein [Candidatus Burarchaeum sp.]MDO8340201.1 NMD3-related protein [Candidatus Burarchaeum sp.]
MDFICPRCGAKSSEKKFVESFCIDCFKRYIDIDTPAAVEIPVCRQCDRVKLAQWQEKDSEAIGKYILKQCKVDYDTAKAEVTDRGECDISFVINAKGARIEVSEHVGIKFLPTMCENCSRTTSGYFEAIIQLRGSDENVEKAMQRLMPVLEKNSFISKIKEDRRGVDLYVGSKQIAAAAISHMNLTPKISNKLHGVRDGQRIYRTTFSVRV